METGPNKGKKKSDSEILSHEFLTIPEVAQLLRVTQRTVYNLIYGGYLQAVRITGRITIIQKTDFMNMLKINQFNSQQKTIEKKTDNIVFPSVNKEVNLTHVLDQAIFETQSEKRSTRKKKPLKPSSDFKQSVKDTFINESEISEPVYTMEEICRKFNYKYGRFYNLRMKYEIPCVKMDGHKCFPIKAVEEAMAKERERLGKDLSEDWYSCFDLMKRHGLGKTQVRRFAMTHGVRMKKMFNRKLYYLKADWDTARKVAEAKSTSTKAARQ